MDIFKKLDGQYSNAIFFNRPHFVGLQVSLTVCRRRSLRWLHPRWRSRSSLHQRESTPYGSEAPSSPLYPPSSRCGSPSRNTTSPVHPLCTGSASKRMRATTNDDILQSLRMCEHAWNQKRWYTTVTTHVRACVHCCNHLTEKRYELV